MPGAEVRRSGLQSRSVAGSLWNLGRSFSSPDPSSLLNRSLGGKQPEGREKAIRFSRLGGFLPIPWVRNSLSPQKLVIFQFEKMNFLGYGHCFVLPLAFAFTSS